MTRKGKQAKGTKRAKPIVLKLKTVSCRTLFTAQRWRTTAGFGLRLRIDARTALDRISFKVPAGLLPRQKAKQRTVGFMRVFVAGQAQRKRFPLKLAKKGRGKLLLKARRQAGWCATSAAASRCAACPRGSAVAELTIYRVTKLDGATKRKRFKLKARVMRAGSRAGCHSASARAPRAERPYGRAQRVSVSSASCSVPTPARSSPAAGSPARPSRPRRREGGDEREVEA